MTWQPRVIDLTSQERAQGAEEQKQARRRGDGEAVVDGERAVDVDEPGLCELTIHTLVVFWSER